MAAQSIENAMACRTRGSSTAGRPRSKTSAIVSLAADDQTFIPRCSTVRTSAGEISINSAFPRRSQPRAAGVQRGNDLVRTQRRPVMELDPGAKAEDPALRRGVMLPREGQCGLRAAVFVEPHESFKYKRLQFVFRRGFGG